MTSAERFRQYKICKERGHTPSGTVLTSCPPWQVCKHCGTGYRTETVLREYNAPSADDE